MLKIISLILILCNQYYLDALSYVPTIILILSTKNTFYPTKIIPFPFQLILVPFVHYFFICSRTGRDLDQQIINPIRMKALLLVKEIYHDGFKNLGSILVKNYLKAFCWFSLILFVVVLYAFIFRISTGFAFD